MKARSHIPLATYRLQLNRDYTFAQATAIVPYLSALGISNAQYGGEENRAQQLPFHSPAGE